MLDYASHQDQESNSLLILDWMISYKTINGEIEQFNIDQISEIAIRTTDQGPFQEDFFWVINVSEKEIIIPQSVQGTDQLLVRMQKLENFDNNQFIEATLSTTNANFLCFKK